MKELLLEENDLKNLKLKNSSFKKLNSEKEKQDYLNIYSLYGKYFVKFMTKHLNLTKYDDIIEKSSLCFKKNVNGKMDIYQYFFRDNLNYFYFRNNFYVERLKEDEKKLLLKKANDNISKIDDEIIMLIENTYRSIIFEDILGDGSKCEILYGPDSSSYLKPNNSLIIGFSYNEYCKDGLDDREWFDLHYEQMSYYRKIFDEMQDSWKELLDIPFSIIKYNNG